MTICNLIRVNVKVLKLDNKDSERFLLMDGTKWVITSSLKAEHKCLKSGESGQICPVHPSNFTTGNPDLPLNSWQFNKMAEGQENTGAGAFLQKHAYMASSLGLPYQCFPKTRSHGPLSEMQVVQTRGVFL